MRKVTKASDTGPDLAKRAGYLVEVAARAPSVHNTQPWRFTVTGQAIELYADASRQLMEDLAGREMIISCGAALFGLRLAVRSLGYHPEAALFPEPGQRRLLARVRAGRPAPMTSDERAMLQAVPHRHTHRGAFEPGPLPGDLLDRLRDDAGAEGATLAVIDDGPAYQRLTAILASWSRWRDLYPTSPAEIQARAETLRWTREAGSQAGDGVPAHAFPAARPGACRSATLTWAGAGDSRRPAARPLRSRRSWWHGAKTRRAGCASVRPCSGYCCAPPVGGSSPASRPSRCNPRRSARRSAAA